MLGTDMKRIIVFALLLSSLTVAPPAHAALPQLYINELQCSGVDWIEIYNPSNVQVDLSQWILTDRNLANGSVTAKHIFSFKTGVVIKAKGYKVVSQGSRVIDMEFGIDCTNQERIFLGKGTGVLWTEVDRINPPAFTAGATHGRTTDGGTTWDATYPTNGTANEPLLPKLNGSGSYTCRAMKKCTIALSATSGGQFELAVAKAGVSLTSGGALTITARKKQKLTLSVKITNQFGTTTKSVVVKVI